MSTSVVNAVIQNHNNGRVDIDKTTYLRKGSRSYSESCDDINEDYTSYKIIEMLKHDKFMSGVDSLNDASAEINKNMRGDGQIYNDNDDGSDGCSLINQHIDIPKFEKEQDYYIEYWKTFMDIKVCRDELMQWADKRNEKIREVLKIMKYYDSNYDDLRDNKPNGRKKHNRRTAKEIPKEYR
jgi:hypothetical protein